MVKARWFLGKLQIPPLRFASVGMTGKGSGSIGIGCRTEVFFISSGGARVMIPAFPMTTDRVEGRAPPTRASVAGTESRSVITRSFV
jgi:hypothetical protein